MFNKFIVFNIFCSQKPCLLTVICDDQCKTRKNIKTTKCNICLKTKNCFVKLIARYKGLTICKTLYLSNLMCQNIFVNFVFKNKFKQKMFNTIKLFDANFGFPISKSILHFKQKNKME